MARRFAKVSEEETEEEIDSKLWYNVLLLLLVLGLNCQNKPNGFSSCCVLRGGADMRFFIHLIW